ncbi:MAG: lyase family protein [Thermodesulfobacteriota bacterium]
MVLSRNLYRIEKDSMGPVKVPKEAYYGAQTQRAVENFPISGWRFQRELIYALGLIKYGVAKVNSELGLLEGRMGKAIEKASGEVMEGKWDAEFVVDIFQTGSGTSTNMNANELIANRADEVLGGRKGTYQPIHPNDHVNLWQSSNDVFPSCIHIASIILLMDRFLPALGGLQKALKKKEEEFHSVLKIGRTHLQDATPIRLGQEFGGYARQAASDIRRFRKAIESLSQLPLGGTAIGTGINTHPLFAEKMIAIINAKTGYAFREAVDHFEAQGARDALFGVQPSLPCSLHRRLF